MRLLVIILLFPATAFAEPVPIRSGDHATFARLVLSIGTDVDWEVAPVGQGYRISLSEDVDGFDTSEIFKRIPRTRIAAAEQISDRALQIDVVCDCHSDAFLWRPGQLVVDIIDGPDPEAEPENMTTVQTQQTATERPLLSEDPQSLPDLLALRGRSSSPIAIPSTLQAVPKPPGVSEAETALIEGVARAASQGFLDAAVSIPVEIEDVSNPETAMAPLIDDTSLEPPVPTRPGVGISTAMEREFDGLRDLIDTQMDQRCLPATLFSIDQWADERAFHVQVADLAEELSGEFGEQPRDAQEALTRVYLHFGFGAEARAVLRADTSMSQSRRVMQELAGIIDDYEEDFSLIVSQAECETPAAMWAFLVKPTSLSDELGSQIIRDFFALPQPLRGQIASRVAQAFVEIKDPESARRILQATQEGDSQGSHDVQATRAMVSEALDDPAEALSVLEAEADDNARTSPTSLIRLIDLALSQGQVPEESDLLLAGAMQQEFRDDPVAMELARAQARGWIVRGQYEQALALIGTQSAEGDIEVIDHAYAHLSEHADPGEFLEFAYREIPESLSDETENMTARRLIDLGFPERATQFLTGAAVRGAAAERRYLRAEAALASGRFIDVIDLLIGLSDDRAGQLRSDAYAALGEHLTALSEAGGNGSLDDTTLQFRAQAWERLAIEEDPALSSFAEVILASPPSEAAVTLADRRELLTNSQESRRAVEELLTRFDGEVSEE